MFKLHFAETQACEYDLQGCKHMVNFIVDRVSAE